MEKSKHKPPSAAYRRNMYWTPEHEETIRVLAEKLKANGAQGVLSRNGKINRTAVIEYALQALEEKLARSD